jgi:hypothetical protein
MEGRLQKAGLNYYRDEDRAMKSDGRHDEVIYEASIEVKRF